ncbi:MAG: sensor histidine kinase [Pseudonocardia sp.]
MTATAAGGRARPLGPLRSRRGAGSGGWPLRRAFNVGAAVAAVLALLAITLGALALYRLVEARTALLDTVNPARSAAENLSAGLLNQETGVRGFDLTGRPEFLEPYRMGTAAEREAVARLRGLSGSEEFAGLAGDVDAVQEAVAAWRTGYADLVIAGAGAPADPEIGRLLFDEIRTRVGALTGNLDAAQADARARVDRASAVVVGTGIGIAAVLLALLVIVGVGLRRGVLVPVSQLAGEVREVVTGDLTRAVTPTGPREIAELGADVEAMRAHIVRELDAQQQVSRRLDQQARDLERSNRDLEQFAYVASHDLQEPLRKVSSFCQLLQRRYGGQLDERADQYIGFAVDGAQRMQRLINDLLAFSRVGRTTEGFEPVDLAAVAAAAAAQLESVRAELAGEIVVGALPEVTGDPALLRQLLLNLVGNGLKFHRDGVVPVVRVEAELRDGAWQVTVTDNGIGIEPEYADKVFVIFQRLHGRDRYPGTGIGLALAKKIVEFHGGRIAVEPAPGGAGTTVRCTLPTQHPSQEDP